MKLLRRGLAIAGAAAIAIAGGLLVNPSPASAHGATVFPGSRQYFCWLDGVSDSGQILPSNPACQDAVADSGVTPLYNWFGNLHPSNNGGTVGSIPDGRICDGGDAGPYDFSPYNAPRTDWPRTHLTAGASYQIQHNNWAHHPGHFDVYLTQDGYNPNSPLSWDDLELIHTEQDPPQSGGPGGLEYYYWDMAFPSNRSGLHLMFIHWVRSDSPEDFFSCSDVIFDGGNGEVSGLDGDPGDPGPGEPIDETEPPTQPGPALVSTVTSTSASLSWGASDGYVTAYELVNTAGGSNEVLAEVTGTPPATSTALTDLSPDTSYAIAVRARNDVTGDVSSLTESAPFTTPSDDDDPGPGEPAGDCDVAYDVTNDWGSGFQAEVTVTNQSDSAINGWELTWTFDGGQDIIQLWNGVDSQSGSSVSVSNATWNGNLSANGGSASFGFLANNSGGTPSDFALNGTACSVS
ncbi:lytic polysaccharide monooxygenase [Natronosporangium hydrolyticum]|uniref:Lytic polysaccharide monooxygenase n=1 Tax=Natronosporangium hydrolyticum TaxID=2811111 RepID=A0A895YFZ0_9ACTN|nr:lytic polysaccharide monooxygenase [Natronosporangium hydrolyticum]QSB15022.1 lytic polysaccharide monooxygenase [Natronosporangium hydrolyticum]